MSEKYQGAKIENSFRGKRVLVTGATGFTGAFLAEKLCNRGADVVAIHRRDNIPESLVGKTIQWIRGNVYDPEVVRAACRDVEFVFHVAAAYREAGIADQIYRSVHVESTRLLAQEALGNPSFQRFVHISTIGVHGHIEGGPADESAPFRPGDIYQKTKAEAELWIREFAAEKKFSLTVIRPTAIYGPGDRRLLKVFRMARLPVVPMIGFGKGYYHLIHVDDLAECMMKAALEPSADGKVFICGNAEPVRLKDMIREIASHLGHHPRFFHIPAAPVFMAASLCESICRRIGVEPFLYPRRVAFFTKDRAFNTGKIREVLGFRESLDNMSGLRQTCDWYRAKGWL